MLPLLKNKKQLIILSSIFLLAVFLRFIQLQNHLFFGFEQGRDFLIAEKISQLSDFVLVGPKTDIDGVFHGAHYYYFLALLFLITGGNPVAISFISAFLSNLAIIPLFLLLKKITKRADAGCIAGLLFAISFHFINYARWLSNVTPAIPLAALALYALYEYSQSKKGLYFLVFIFCAFFAAQFEIILALWLVFFIFCALALKIIALPKLKTIVASGVILFALFAPFILFNIRNQWITVHSVQAYLSEGSTSHTSFGPLIQKYLFLQAEQFQEHLIRIPKVWVGIITLAVFFLSYVQRKSFTAAETTALKLSTLWFFMTLPVLFFPKSLSLVQLYIVSGLGLLVFSAILLHKLFTHKFGKIYLIIVGVVLGINGVANTKLLYENLKDFFTTIQDGHNLHDQRELLAYIHSDSQNTPYHFKAFTIPYYQEEGWQYLQSYYLGDKTGIEYQTVYLIIEKPVDPMWREKWTAELGPTKLVEEKKFGYFTVEKRVKTQNK
jgi:hypothetical protein